MKLAAAAYPLDWFDRFADYEAKISDWVATAAADGAELLLFPEYGAMELASLGGVEVAQNLEAALHAVAAHGAAVTDTIGRLARQYDLHILAASAPVFPPGSSRPVNRASFYGPEGMIGFQDKQIMTRFEREIWSVRSGPGLTLFDTALGKIGVLICYDSEFPLLARHLVEAGAEILLVPSCTDSYAGYQRVRIGAMARALENQCVTLQSPIVGRCNFCPAVDENIGRASIYAPPDHGWPETGILAETELNSPGWALADIDRALIAETRANGGVLNHRHWPEQQAQITSAPAKLAASS
jgi:predicted amidohydrolase